MKKFILFLTLLLMPILSVYAAGSVTVSKSSLTITTGSSATFNVTAKNAAGRIDISSSNKNVATVSVSNAFLDNSSVKVKPFCFILSTAGSGSKNTPRYLFHTNMERMCRKEVRVTDFILAIR